MTESQLEHIGKTLRESRRAKGLTQAELGRLTEIDRQTVSDIERGKFTGSLRTLLRYLRFANLELTTREPAGRFPNLDELADRYGPGDD